MGRIEHVVVLMLENRSFDHLLGYLDHPDKRFEGVPDGAYNVDPRDGRRVLATEVTDYPCADPDHSHYGVMRQIGRGGDVVHNGGFVRDYCERDKEHAGLVMECLTPKLVPALSKLALEFAVCDHWFSSVPGETWPNRHFAHAATSSGAVDIEPGLYYDPTIFEQLDRRKRTWRVYYDGPPELWAFPKLWRKRTILDFLLRRPNDRTGNWFEFPKFFDHVGADDLPDYTFIEPAHNHFHSPPSGPRQTNSQHPHNNVSDPHKKGSNPCADVSNPCDFVRGDRLVARIYEALRLRPELFKKTLFVITYDEHGGLYDHVKPDPCDPPDSRNPIGLTLALGRFARRVINRLHRQPSHRFRFDHYGVRVPAILVSPWIDRGRLVKTVFDHASIPATVRALFLEGAPALTKRDRMAATFHKIVEDSPRGSPRTSPGVDTEGDLPDLSGLIQQEPTPTTSGGGDTEGFDSRSDDTLQLQWLSAQIEVELTRRPPRPSGEVRSVRSGRGDARTRGDAPDDRPEATGSGPVCAFAGAAARVREATGRPAGR